jgi:hypothetical protein
MVLCLVRVLAVRIRRITLSQISFTVTCFDLVLCPAIIVGPNIEKEGLYWKTMKKKEMMTNILATVDERRPQAKEKRAMAELIVEENKTMMMDLSLMDEFTKEWWNVAHM